MLLVITKYEVTYDSCTVMTRIVHGRWEAVRAFVPESEMLLTGPATANNPSPGPPHTFRAPMTRHRAGRSNLVHRPAHNVNFLAALELSLSIRFRLLRASFIYVLSVSLSTYLLAKCPTTWVSIQCTLPIPTQCYDLPSLDCRALLGNNAVVTTHPSVTPPARYKTAFTSPLPPPPVLLP